MGDYHSPVSGLSDSHRWTGLAGALATAGRYCPVERLGKTSGRQTLLCNDAETGQRVVIKLLTFGEDFAWDDLKLFEREAETLRSLDHPAIPQYLDYFDLETPSSKGFALVQGYIEAPSMQEQLQAGQTFSEAEIQQIGQDLLNILDYLHSRQPAVIHRDIKPSNILLSDRTAHSPGKVYLVDFGSVQTLAAREGGTITVVGTYGYMPPEQFGGRAVPASDLYSLGATLIYLASGRHPADLPQDELRIEFEDFVKLSPRAITWLRQLTEPSLGKRAKSVAQALESIQPQFAEAIHKSQPQNIVHPVNAPSASLIQLNQNPLGETVLKLPSQNFRIRKIDGDGCGTSLMVLFFLFFGLPLLGIVISMIVAGVGGMGSFATFVVFSLIAGGLWGIWQLISVVGQNTLITLGKDRIRIERGGEMTRRLKRNHAWRLVHYSDKSLALAIGTEELVFRGTHEELIWLKPVPGRELNLAND